MQDTTLLFLIKKEQNTISEICLAMKKRGFGAGKYNGVGGKLLPGESLEQALIRECKEEIDVQAGPLTKVAELEFHFAAKPDWDQLVHVYFCEVWEGEPTESEEMNPRWFNVQDIPFQKMWTDDPFWLPRVLEGKFIKAQFLFGEEGEGNVILEKDVQEVASL